MISQKKAFRISEGFFNGLEFVVWSLWFVVCRSVYINSISYLNYRPLFHFRLNAFSLGK